MGESVGRVAWALLLAITLAGCAAAIARNPVPASLEGDVEVVGMGPTPIDLSDRVADVERDLLASLGATTAGAGRRA